MMTWINKALRWLRYPFTRLGVQNDNLSKREDVRTEISKSFNDLTEELCRLVRSGKRVQSETLLHDLRQRFPVPHVDILPKEVWGSSTDQLVLRSHESLDLAQAIRNVESTGRSLSSEEENQLETITLHWCGWSPMASEHRNDSWVQFLRHTYPDLDGLQPILDSLIWPEEITRYPIDHTPMPPWLFFLATKSKYYIYNFQDVAMLEAGSTLTEVIDGMREERWTGNHMWKLLSWMTTEDSSDYFPVYDDIRDASKQYRLEREIKEFSLQQ